MEFLHEISSLIKNDDIAAIENFMIENQPLVFETEKRVGLSDLASLPRDDSASIFIPRGRLDVGIDKSIVPLSTIGDGNCLYNACSLAMYGHENLNFLLRALTSAELFLHSHFYSTLSQVTDLFNEQESSQIFSSLFAKCISFEAQNHFNKEIKNFEQCIKLEAELNCRPCRFSSFVCMMALSTVVKTPIMSCFPETGTKHTARLMNVLLNPQADCTVGREPIHLLWTKSGGKRESINPWFQADHIVPLVILSSPHPVTILTTKSPKCLSTKSVKISVMNTSKLVEETPKKQTTISFAPKQHSPVVKTEKPFIDPPLEPSKYDIGTFYLNADTFSDEQKYDILSNVWQPDGNFKFPIRILCNKNRKFLPTWLQKFSWLTYSRFLDGAFCLPCVLFGRRVGSNAAKLDKLMKSPFVDWSCASRRFNDHETKSDVHKTSVLTMHQFILVMENKVKSVSQIHDHVQNKKVEENRLILASIIMTVLLCGRYNIPFRGHRDDSDYYETVYCGIFQALLDFRVDSGDKVLQEHFATAPRNATYRSKTTQNELIICCAEVITKQIINEIKQSKYFSILADEVTDCSNKEQMPLVIRYVDKSGCIKERFLKYILCDTGTSGQALAEKIVDCITNDFGLDLQDCRGQCYDGAANMSGKYSGVSTRILEQNEFALYTHCSSHRLNLCVASSCQIQTVRNMMENVKVISKFFNNSPKKQNLLEKMIKKFHPDVKETKLVDVCRTRWIMRIDGLQRFIKIFKAISEALFAICDNTDNTWTSSAAEAYGLAAIVTSFEFIQTLVTVSNCLGYTLSATIQLQGADIDLLKGLREVDVMMSSLQAARNQVDLYHRAWFNKASEMAEEVGADIRAPRVCRSQQHRSNTPSNDVESHYKLNVAIPFLDHLISEMSRRFSSENCSALKGFSIIPAYLKKEGQSPMKVGAKRKHDASTDHDCYGKKCHLTGNESAKPKAKITFQRLDKNWKKDFLQFCIFFASDFPDPDNLSHEVDNWESAWSGCCEENTPKTIAETLQKVNKIAFPNIFTALKILAVLPVTSCTCERAASYVRLLKTYLRSTMSQERLNGLATLYTHRDIKVDVAEVIDRYAMKHRRKLALTNILQSENSVSEQDEIYTSEMY